MKKNNKKLIYLVYLQFFLASISGVLFVLYLFNEKYLNLMQIFLGVTLIFMSYVCSKIYNKNKYILMSLIFGILLIIFSIFNFLGVF